MKGNDEKRNCLLCIHFLQRWGEKQKGGKLAADIIHNALWQASLLLHTTIGLNLPRTADGACPLTKSKIKAKKKKKKKKQQLKGGD